MPARESTAAAAGEALADFARTLVGTPYRNGGSDPEGFDCSGFVQYVFAQRGLALPRSVREQWRAGVAVEAERVRAGDLLFFATARDEDVSHVGIALDGETFVHAPSAHGSVRVERRGAAYWSRRFAGARRVE